MDWPCCQVDVPERRGGRVVGERPAGSRRTSHAAGRGGRRSRARRGIRSLAERGEDNALDWPCCQVDVPERRGGRVVGELTCPNGEVAEWSASDPQGREGRRTLRDAAGGGPEPGEGSEASRSEARTTRWTGLVVRLTCPNGEVAEWSASDPQGREGRRTLRDAAGGGPEPGEGSEASRSEARTTRWTGLVVRLTCPNGEVAEWSKALDWNSSNTQKVFVGSNPTLSAST